MRLQVDALQLSPESYELQELVFISYALQTTHPTPSVQGLLYRELLPCH
jgi:hypothetical protein